MPRREHGQHWTKHVIGIYLYIYYHYNLSKRPRSLFNSFENIPSIYFKKILLHPLIVCTTRCIPEIQNQGHEHVVSVQDADTFICLWAVKLVK